MVFHVDEEWRLAVPANGQSEQLSVDDDEICVGNLLNMHSAHKARYGDTGNEIVQF